MRTKNTVTVAVVDSNQHYDLLLKSGLWNNDSQRILLKPNIAHGHPDELQSPTARSMLNLCVEQNLLEGPLSAQDSYQLAQFANLLSRDHDKVEVILCAAGGLGFYMSQLKKLGMSPDNIVIKQVKTLTMKHVFRDYAKFPHNIDHLAAISQERLETNNLEDRYGAAEGPSSISITACIPHRNRPDFLVRSLESLLGQSKRPCDIVIVDDGSDAKDAIVALDRIASSSYCVPVTILRIKRQYPSAARNQGWMWSKTSHVAYLDDDDIAYPNYLEALANAAIATDADVVTSLMDYFEDDEELQRGGLRQTWLPLGGCGAVGLYANLFGPANALVKRSCLEKNGGYRELQGVGHEDWELYARIWLQGGSIEVVPIPLFSCRRTGRPSMTTSTPQFENHINSLSPFLSAVPESLRDAILTGFGSVTWNEGPVRDMWKERHHRNKYWATS